MQNLNPIYTGDRGTLANARNLLATELRAESLKWPPALVAGIREWLEAYPSLAADLRAQVATGKSRPCRRPVALKVVFIDEGGGGRGRLGELLMEQIADAGAKGELYPADNMAGVCTDSAWNDSLKAAIRYARECGFGITPGTDVRWSVRQLPPGIPWDEDSSEHKPRPLGQGDHVTGRSAGVAFFLGLFALAQTEDAPGEWKAHEVVKRIVALATLPDTEDHTAIDSLGTLGGDETKKLAALKDLPADMRVLVVFPRAYTGRSPFGYDELKVTTVAELAAVLRLRCAPPISPDFLPNSCRASRYIGSRDEVQRLKESLRCNRLHVVTGPGGVGKTARVVEAAEQLWQEGVFPGGRFWIDLYGASEPRRTAGKVVATTCGEAEEQTIDELRDQTRRLLAKHPSLVFLEGAETLPEREIAGLLDWFSGPTTVVWMTRRETDVRHRCLRGAKHHAVHALSQADALELLCYAAERKLEELSAAERADLVEIAEATERLPLLLGWAGAALQPDRDTTPAEYLAELKADPMGSIADPDDRGQLNAGRFLRRSLARIVATAEMPDLPAVAKRFFAGLAAFHPVHGAPLSWWPLAAGLDASKSAGAERFSAAKRALLGLGLATAEGSSPGAGGSAKTVHVVHALAGAVAADLWHEQPSAKVRATLGALCEAATAALKTPLPVDWFRNAAWLGRRTAEAAHYGHWLNEVEILQSGADPANLDAPHALCRAWTDFLEKHAQSLPLLTLKEVAWTAVCKQYQQLVAAHPNDTELHRRLSGAWDHLGAVFRKNHAWRAAKEVFNKAKDLDEKQASAHPADLEIQCSLAASLVRLGNVNIELEDLDAAEAAFNTARDIAKDLTQMNSSKKDFQRVLATSLMGIGNLAMTRLQWLDAEMALSEAATINRQLMIEGSLDPSVPRAIVAALQRVGDARGAQHDWRAAVGPFKLALKMSRILVAACPNLPDPKFVLTVSLQRLCNVLVEQHQWAAAGETINEAIELGVSLAAEYPEWLDNQLALAVSWETSARIHKEQMMWEAAAKALRAAKAIYNKLAIAHPEVAKFRVSLSEACASLAEMLGQFGTGDEAVEAMTQALVASVGLIAPCPADLEFQGEIVLRAICVCDLVKRLECGENANRLWERVAPRLTYLVSRFLEADGELTELQKVLISFAKQNGLDRDPS